MTTPDTTIAADPLRSRALSYPDFRSYIVQRLLTTMAISIQSVVVGYQIYDMTGKTLNLGFVGLAQFLPNIVLALFAGQVADKYDRRHILRAAIAVQLLCSLALILMTVTGNDQVLPIYAVLVVFGAARAFMAPASQSIIPKLVHRDALSGAIALGSSMFMTAQIFGPALGGVLYGYWGASAAFAASWLFFAGALMANAKIKVSLRPEASTGATGKDILGGIKFIRANPAILGAISLDLFAVLLGGATALLPVYARDILLVGQSELGLLRAAPAAGALVMSLVLARTSLGDHSGIKMFVSVLAFGIATIVFGVSTSFPISLLALATLGAADVVSVYMRTNLVQRTTPDAMRGRVSAVNWVFIGASNELGEMESGFTAYLFDSPEAAVVVGGVGTCAVVGLWAWKFPALRRVRRLEEIEASPS